MKNSRERVLNAVNHQKHDKIPIDFWSTAETDVKLFQHLGLNNHAELLDAFNVDIVYIEGPSYTGPPLKVYPDSSSDDIWGVTRKTCFTGSGDKKQSYKAVVNSPLKDAQSAEDVLNYDHWPSPDDFDYSCIGPQCRAAGGRAVFFMGDRLNRIAQFKPAQYLRGMEQLLMDVILNTDLFLAIINRIADFYDEYLRRILTAANGMIDVLVSGDDFGTQNGLIISRQMWRDYLAPRFANFIAISHSFNVPVMHHTCGGIYDLIPDMLEAGLNVLNPLQPNTAGMDFARIKAQFGDQLCFHGGISLQTNLPFGSPADVKAEVKNAFQSLGRNTGYIACTAHNIQADTPTENIIALLEAYNEYRTHL